MKISQVLSTAYLARANAALDSIVCALASA